MSVAAVLLVKDEADVIAATVEHLLAQVDAILVADNLSTDGTRAILDDYAERGLLHVETDYEVGYQQSAKTTRLARLAYDLGFDWVVPCDADEFWFATEGQPLRDQLDALPPEMLFAQASLLNYLTTDEDDQTDENPVTRIRWRLIEPGAMTKVACRTSSDLTIEMGNHDAVSNGRVRATWNHTYMDGIAIRHYPWRSEAQFVRKITNGSLAYAAAPDLDPGYGEHWKAFGLPHEAGFIHAVRGWFWAYGHRAGPRSVDDLIYDPAPVA